MRLAAVLLALAAPVAADEAAILEAFELWVGQNDVTRAALAITKDGVLVSDHGRGMQPDEPVPLASLSKAITGACILALEAEGLVSQADTLGEIFVDRPELLGQGAAIRVDDLMTHSSGLDFDRTQTILNPSIWGSGDISDRVAGLALARPRGAETFFYNNENYAVLGSVIMEVTGQTVQEACAPRVLDGLESAAPDGRTGGGLPWGGWSMTVADYARFAASLEPDESWPRQPVGSASYGPGVLLRDTPNGPHMWHFGGFCVMGLGDYGSYFYVLANGWGVVVWYDICATSAQATALDNALARAAYSGG